MATTTNYGWTTPDDTALVKDGAAAIRSLGTAIDTSMNTALGTKKAGLVLLNTTSFSAVASQTIDSIFTSTYQNYRVIFSGTATNSTGLVWRFRTSGSDNSNSNYSNAFYRYQSDNTVSGEDGRESSSLWQWLNAAASQPWSVSADIFSPQESAYTYSSMTGFISTSSTRVKGLFGGAQFGATTQFDGFNLFVTAGTITGKVRVYGYNQ